jgi:hypothetical protein
MATMVKIIYVKRLNNFIYFKILLLIIYYLKSVTIHASHVSIKIIYKNILKFVIKVKDFKRIVVHLAMVINSHISILFLVNAL